MIKDVDYFTHKLLRYHVADTRQQNFDKSHITKGWRIYHQNRSHEWHACEVGSFFLEKIFQLKLKFEIPCSFFLVKNLIVLREEINSTLFK